MRKNEIVLFERFLGDMSNINSFAVVQHVRKLLDNLASFPNMGRAAESRTLVGRFGEGVRTLVCGNYLFVYVYEGDVVKVLALYPARLVR